MDEFKKTTDKFNSFRPHSNSSAQNIEVPQIAFQNGLVTRMEKDRQRIIFPISDRRNRAPPLNIAIMACSCKIIWFFLAELHLLY